ncbi:hypothetical protein CON48_09885 [Bacillus thuringiensis]|uniref:Uncharacterized protein n=3 Tax=Bacteria TaxID=2 RepID=A0A9X6ULS3_BACCE|nr:hypothetical protein B4918_26955 [Bacillus thuringiensis]AXR19564.1 hypothetical protein DOS87_27320 [Bacillus sp. CR71]AXR25298.1 hypothetical protein DPQ26_27335 [Bacillus sp. E25]AZV68680.1 hypothetical protein DT426_24490 [Bacillus cereus]EXL35355.1 hypothetical protein BG78_03355 [Bacillus thuringiensis serovar israelensis]KAA0803175.1 hypothetical protein DN406_01190 [Bacillus sp. BB56-3]KAA0820008.1 hypothetical protein DN403_21380 [Bacillus sp. AY2-1]KAB2372028.1 hypothetical prot
MLFSINDPYPAKGVYWGYTRETGKGIYIELYINPEVRSRSPLPDYLAINYSTGAIVSFNTFTE